MKTKTILYLGCAIATLQLTSPSHAVPTFDQFGPFPNATFGGVGIPNDSVAASTQFVADFDAQPGRQSAQITLAMNTTQRFSNDVVTNDGFGTFFAEPGSNFGNPLNPLDQSSSSLEGATWNFNFYILVEGINGSDPTLADFQIDLLYDFDPGVNTPTSEQGRINITNGAIAAAIQGNTPVTSLAEGSENLLFNFLETGIPNIVMPPTSVNAFSPEAIGEYSFSIEVISLLDGSTLETVGISVVVPEPSSLALLGLASLGLAVRRRA